MGKRTDNQKLKKQEMILHAAVKSVDGQIFMAKNHGDCFHKAHAVGVKMSSNRKDQGFFTNKGRYLNRYEAAELVKQNGQSETNDYMLFSEHLWDVMYKGVHQYDPIEGYFLETPGDINV